LQKINGFLGDYQMKKIIVILVGITFLAGCAPDGAYMGAMILDADLGPYNVNEIVPMFGLQWDLRSPSSTSSITKDVSSDRGDLSK